MTARAEAVARGPAIWMLAAAETLAYACFYYIFAALIVAWQAELGWDRAVLATGPTLSIILAAVLAPVMGRLVDAGKGPEVMAGGAVIGALALVGLALSDSPATYLMAWGVIGLAQAACLYEVCFAFLIRRLGTAARPAITRVTLMAGFAGTIAFPAGAAMSAGIGWRGAVLVAAVVASFVMVPLYLGAGRLIRRSGLPVQSSLEADKGALKRALNRPQFYMLAVIFALVSFNHWMIVNFAVPIFLDLGAGAALAVLAAATVGPAQVAGRLILFRFEARLGTAITTLICLGGMAAGTMALFAAGLAPWLIFVFTGVQGGAIGVMTILRPVLIAAVMGPAGYGAIAGAIQVPALLAGALAPLLGALMLAGPGVPGVLALSLGLILVAAVLARATLSLATS
jgi:MFS family permease